MRSELNIVDDWHTALNSGDIAQLSALVDDNVEVGGSRGMSQGVNVLREWFERANIQLHPLRTFHRANDVVVEERGEWHSPTTGEITGTQTVASHFVVKNDRIFRIMRYDDLNTALNEAHLSDADEVH